jgi:EAL domain-containing protein (putative c-di-GMP-specific phosphodiesterase class I)
MISPKDFVDVAEETGLIVPMGKWILETACRQIGIWQKDSEESLSVSVNLSARQLMHPSLVAQIEAILIETELSPRQLKLEVTENTVMEYSERAQAVLKDLDRLGVHLSTDDFGTGYSSLSYLQSFPFDRLKIDRSFVDRIGKNKKSDTIVKTILMLGANLGMEVVAEGIETSGQLEFLQELGCRFGQGFYFSKPVSAAEAERLISSGSSDLYLAPVEDLMELAGVQ